MSIKIAINGYGRIGRCTLRAIWEYGLQDEFDVVAINASGDIATNAHLTRYDTTHGRFATTVETDGENCMIVGGKRIPFYSTKNPKDINWADHGVDILLECTGAYTTKVKAQELLNQGAKRVLISAPGGDDVDTTIVMGVNESALKPGMTVVSNASKAVGLVLPQLVGKVDGFALRVPTINVSLVDLTFTADRATTKEEINALMTAAANGPLKGIMDVNNEPLVSSDFNHTTVSSTFDATQTRVIKGDDGSVLVKVLAWYDNEWGYSCRMLDAARAWMAVK
jgi:glyceraldehyde-3-phosphate dehydrogenase/erythrose-4-phosphate dehydrogenase